MSDDQQLEPIEMRPGRNGGTLRTGNPGNRGNPNGRTGSIPTKERAGRVLQKILAKLEDRLDNGPPLSARDMVGYGRLAAEVEARDLPGDKPPVRVMVLRGSEADLRAATATPVVEQADVIEAEDGREILGTGDPPTP